jgi:starvation-inducible outer membrane lipoprotein
MKKISILFLMALAIYSCGRNASKQENAAVKQLQELEVVDVSIDSLIANPSVYANQTVRFSAMVEHVCKHSGQKLTVIGSLPEATIKVMGSEVVPSFEVSLDGAKVEVTGLVKAMATEHVETCEVDSTAQNITYAVECKAIKLL